MPINPVGNNTFIHSKLNLVGFNNAYGHGIRYPKVDLNELLDLNSNLSFFLQNHTLLKKNILMNYPFYVVMLK